MVGERERTSSETAERTADADVSTNDTQRAPALDRRHFIKGVSVAAGAGLASSRVGRASRQGETIQVGASAALTGKYSQEGTTMRQGYELWVEQINEQGGILDDSVDQGLLGRDVELVIYDDQSDPARAVNLYQRLITEDDVDLLMGPYSSAVSTSVIPIIEQSQRACVMPMMSDTSVLAERDVSYITQSIAPASTYVKGAIDIAASNDAESVAVVYEDTAFPTSVAEGHIPYAEEQGLEVVHQEAYPKDINDYTPILNKVSDADPDVVMGGGYTPDAIGLTKAAKSVDLEAGIFAWVVGGTVPAFREGVGGDAHAITGDAFWAPSQTPPASTSSPRTTRRSPRASWRSSPTRTRVRATSTTTRRAATRGVS
jgi:branched-chain amino acid transport system substrate-binding protein